jgi:hypothetical protein
MESGLTEHLILSHDALDRPGGDVPLEDQELEHPHPDERRAARQRFLHGVQPGPSRESLLAPELDGGGIVAVAVWESGQRPGRALARRMGLEGMAALPVALRREVLVTVGLTSLETAAAVAARRPRSLAAVRRRAIWGCSLRGQELRSSLKYVEHHGLEVSA